MSFALDVWDEAIRTSVRCPWQNSVAKSCKAWWLWDAVRMRRLVWMEDVLCGGGGMKVSNLESDEAFLRLRRLDYGRSRPLLAVSLNALVCCWTLLLFAMEVETIVRYWSLRTWSGHRLLSTSYCHSDVCVTFQHFPRLFCDGDSDCRLHQLFRSIGLFPFSKCL